MSGKKCIVNRRQSFAIPSRPDVGTPIWGRSKSRSALITTKFTNRAKPVEKVVEVVNHTFQPILEAHNLDLWEYIPLQELSGRYGQPSRVVAIGWRRSDVHGPVGTRIPRRSSYLVLQEVRDIGYISVHREIR